MRDFLKVVGFRAIITLLAVTALCSCSLPEQLPTPTPTPDWTATPIPPTATPTQTPTPTATPLPEYLVVPADSLDGMKLTLRYSMDGKVRDTLKELVSRYNKENTEGITVRIEQAYSLDELASAVTENHKGSADIVIADSAWLRSLNANSGNLMDLSDFMNSPDLSIESAGAAPIMPVMLASEEFEGKYHALPLWAEPSFLFYNKTWAVELGFEDTPDNLAAFAEQACAAGKANYADEDESKHGTGGWIISSEPGGVMSWLLTFSREALTPGRILRGDSAELFSDTAAWLRNLYDNGCAWNSRVREPYNYFANRYALFYSGTYADAERQLNAFAQSAGHSFDNWDLIVYPGRSAGRKNDPRIYADSAVVGISKGNAESVNAAWRFVRWLYEGEHAAELSLAAGGWPVQDTDPVTRLYRNSGKDKLYQTLSLRQYMVNRDADDHWLTDQRILADGFAYIFNLSATAEDIPNIWDQIGSSIAEINAVSGNSGSTEPDEGAASGENYEIVP